MLLQSLIARFFNKLTPANEHPILIAVAVAVLLILLAAVLAPLLFMD